MNQSQKQKVLLAAIIGASLIIFYYRSLLTPAFTRLLNISREVAGLKREIISKEALINNLPNLSKEFANLKERAHFVENSLPNEKEIPGLLEELSRIAEESNVKILKIRPQGVLKSTLQNPKIKPPYIEQPILLEAKSGFHELGRFLEKLENLNRFVKINRLSIVGDKQDMKYHNVKLEVSTYVLQ